MNQAVYNIDHDIGRWVSFSFFALVFIVALILELHTSTFVPLITSVSSGASAIIAGSTRFMWWYILIEIAVFAAIWIILYLIVFRIFKPNKNHFRHKDVGTDLINREIVVIKAASNVNFIPERGTTKIGDVNYMVLPVDPIYLPPNTVATVVDVKGATLMVKPVRAW